MRRQGLTMLVIVKASWGSMMAEERVEKKARTNTSCCRLSKIVS